MAQYREAVGVEIKDASAFLVLVRRRFGQSMLRSQWEVPLPADAAGAVEALRGVVNREGLAGLPAMVALSGKSVVFRSIRRDTADPRSVQQIVRMEAEHFDDLSRYETVHDGHVVHIPRDGQQVFLAVTRADAAIRAIDLPARAGLQVLDVAPAPVAWFNAVADLLPHKDDDSCVLVRLGQDGTDVLVALGNHLLFVRRLPIGARSFDTESFRSPMVSPASADTLDDWIEEVRSCLELYRTELPASAPVPGRIYLAGGERRHQDVAARLTEQLRLPAQSLEEVFSPDVASDLERFGAAGGLADEAVRERGVHLSLLPRELQQRMALRLQLKYWVLTGVTLIAAMGFLVLVEYQQSRQSRRALRSRQLQIAQFQEAQESLVEHQRLNRELRGKVAVLEASSRNAAVVRDVLRAVAAAKDPDDWITVVADAASYVSATMAIPAADELGPDRLIRQIVVEGYTPWEDLSSVRDMIAELQAHPAVLVADLLGDDQLIMDEEEVSRWEEMACRLFAIELSLAP